MKTLKVTLDDTPQAELLAEMLEGLTFVKSVEETSNSLITDSLIEEVYNRRKRIRQHLLEAPTLNEEELSEYRENREYLNQWRTK